jgi:hypothetical protein
LVRPRHEIINRVRIGGIGPENNDVREHAGVLLVGVVGRAKNQEPAEKNRLPVFSFWLPVRDQDQGRPDLLAHLSA